MSPVTPTTGSQNQGVVDHVNQFLFENILKLSLGPNSDRLIQFISDVAKTTNSAWTPQILTRRLGEVLALVNKEVQDAKNGAGKNISANPISEVILCPATELEKSLLQLNGDGRMDIAGGLREVIFKEIAAGEESLQSKFPFFQKDRAPAVAMFKLFAPRPLDQAQAEELNKVPNLAKAAAILYLDMVIDNVLSRNKIREIPERLVGEPGEPLNAQGLEEALRTSTKEIATYLKKVKEVAGKTSEVHEILERIESVLCSNDKTPSAGIVFLQTLSEGEMIALMLMSSHEALKFTEDTETALLNRDGNPPLSASSQATADNDGFGGSAVGTEHKINTLQVAEVAFGLWIHSIDDKIKNLFHLTTR